MANSASAWLALDVGGANLKTAHSGGRVRSMPFELWKNPDGLPGLLTRAAASSPPFDRVAVTMTAELCDCFATKREGVLSVLGAVRSGIPDVPAFVWGTDGLLHRLADVRRNPPLAAASNWLALATVASKLVEAGPGLLIDVGSTTTDLIPLNPGIVAARGRTDTQRLQNGELVYAGVRRTPVCALADRLPFRGKPTALAAELFATTLDVFLTLGDIPTDTDDRGTADSRPATVEAARDRLARMVGADGESFDDGDALGLSQAVEEIFLSRIVRTVFTATIPGHDRPKTIVVAGSGEFVANRAADRIVAAGGRVVRLSDVWGTAASGAACARALVEIACESETFEE